MLPRFCAATDFWADLLQRAGSGKDVTPATLSISARGAGDLQDPFGTYNPFYKVDAVFDMVIQKFKLTSGRQEAQKLTEEALEVVGLRANEILGKYPHELVAVNVSALWWRGPFC
ncbi:MAG: hypothetical protein R2932_11235 [Caldilineaceae bacterium]